MIGHDTEATRSKIRKQCEKKTTGMTGIASISCARWMVFEVMLSFLGLSKAELLALGVAVIQYGKIRNQWKRTTARQRQGLKRQPLRLKGENLERIRHGMAGLGLKSSHLVSNML